MAIAVTVTQGPGFTNDTTEQTQIVRGTLSLSGNYGGGSTHGDTLSFAGVYGIQSNAVPVRVLVFQQPASGTAPGNCTGVYCPGTTMNNGVVSFANAGTELTQGSAYSGAASTAVWVFEAVFPALV
jgi:hypothetical protein